MSLINNIQNAIDFIEDNIIDNISIKEVSENVYLSESYLRHIFAAFCSVTIGEYIRNRRLSLSKDDLKNSNENILQIALKYCYSTQEGYSRAFYRYYGLTPSAARSLDVELESFNKISVQKIFYGGNNNMDMKSLTERANLITSVHAIYYTNDMDKTAKWFEDILGWSSVVEARDENNNPVYGSTVPYPKELVELDQYDFSKAIMFLSGEPIQNTYLFYNTKDIQMLHDIITENGWDEVTDIVKQPWGGMTFELTTIDGTGITFCG